MDNYLGKEIKEIRAPEDVTQEHIKEAADMREGLYGNTPLSWEEVVYKLETTTEDWGSTMESPAIKHLQKKVREELRERTA